MGGYAWVTLATNDSYSLGALVLAHSLKQVGTVHQLAVLITPGVTGVMRNKLTSVFDVVKEVNILDSQDEANLRLLKRPELGVTFTKLHCWRLTQFDKCVFLDADTLVLANADELFDKEEFSAAPDVGWPDCFNSGVFVYRPSEDTYSKLVQFAIEKGSFDGGDQGLLNLYFSDWAHKDISKHLPFIYNMCSTACYSYLPAFKQFGGNVKIIHFIGNTKPWLQYFDSQTRSVQVVSDIQHLQVVVQQWWNIFCSHIHSTLSPEMAGLAGAFARLTLGEARSPEQALLEDQIRRQGWEVGNIDYMGRDSFDNIWSKICETLNAEPPTPDSSHAPSPPSQQPSPSTVAPEQEVVKQVVSECKQDPILTVFEQIPLAEIEQPKSIDEPKQPKTTVAESTVTSQQTSKTIATPSPAVVDSPVVETVESSVTSMTQSALSTIDSPVATLSELSNVESSTPQSTLSTATVDSPVATPLEVSDVKPTETPIPQPVLSTVTVDSPIVTSSEPLDVKPVPASAPQPALTTATADSPIVTPTELPDVEPTIPSKASTPQSALPTAGSPIVTPSEPLDVKPAPASAPQPALTIATVDSPIVTPTELSDVKPIVPSIASTPQSALPTATIDSSTVTPPELPIVPSVVSTPQSALPTATVDSPIVTPTELPVVEPIVPSVVSIPQSALPTATIDSSTVTLPDVEPAAPSVVATPQSALSTATVDSPTVTPSEVSKLESIPLSEVSSPQSPLPTAIVDSAVTTSELPKVESIKDGVTFTPQSKTEAPTLVKSPESPKIKSALPTVTTSETSKVEIIKTPISPSQSSEPIPPPIVKQVVATQPPPSTSEGPKLKPKPEILTKTSKELPTGKSTSDCSQKVAESQPSPEKEPKTPETPKPSSTPTTKSKKDAKQSAASQSSKASESPQGPKPPANVPKPVSEQAVAQKSAQTKPETPASPEGPVPPPRKAAAATAGAKKSAKGKK